MANKKTSKPQANAAKNKSSTAGKRSGRQPKAARNASPKTPAKPKTPQKSTTPKAGGRNSKSTSVVKRNRSRTASGKVPQGRTLTTHDKYLDKKAKEPGKERPVVVIEVNDNDELAVVQLSTTAGKDRTRLPKYQQGQSRFKHYVEIEDSDGEPIKVNAKFKENHPNMDVSRSDVDKIIDTVLNHSKPMQKNRKRIDKFRGKKK